MGFTPMLKDAAMTASTLRWPTRRALAPAVLILGACGGGGGGSGPAPAAPAAIDAGNAATIAREVIGSGLGAGSFGAAVGGGSILSADGSANATALGMLRQRRTIQRAQPAVNIPPETFDCLENGTVRLSGSLASDERLTPGDRINADFNACDEADGLILDGGMRIDVSSFSGDIFNDLYRLGARVTLSSLTMTEDGESATGNGTFDLDLDLTEPLRSDLTVSGPLFEVSAGGDHWVLRDFALTILEDGTGPAPLTQYSGTGTLEGAGFGGAVDFVTVVPLTATGDHYPATGEVLITGADDATIRATALDDQTVRLAIDLDGDTVVDETQEVAWSTVGPLGLEVFRANPTTPVLLPVPQP